jgi:chromosome condensin MukBEF ATPase and DNA-binding subunit MukB
MRINSLNDDVKRASIEFFSISPSGDQVKRIELITDALVSIKASYDQSRNEYTQVLGRVDGIMAAITALKKKMKDRDFAYWEKAHYELKLDKMRMKSSLAHSEKMERNYSKFSRSQSQYDELNREVIEELRQFNSERFDLIEDTLKMYMLHVDRYFSGVSKKMGEVLNSEIEATRSFHLTPLGSHLIKHAAVVNDSAIPTSVGSPVTAGPVSAITITVTPSKSAILTS